MFFPNGITIKVNINFNDVKKRVINFIILFSIFTLLTPLAFTGYSKWTTSQAVSDCSYSYTGLTTRYDGAEVNVSQEDFIDNCTTLEKRVRELLTSYGNTENFPIIITDELNTLCGEGTIGCVQSADIFFGIIPPIMSISWSADYWDKLDLTVAHEYNHILLSTVEESKLNQNPEIWYNAKSNFEGVTYKEFITPAEGVADCGISHFTQRPFEQGSYMDSCTPEQVAIAESIINDTYVK